jgi:uncharacterized protein with PIN domain
MRSDQARLRGVIRRRYVAACPRCEVLVHVAGDRLERAQEAIEARGWRRYGQRWYCPACLRAFQKGEVPDGA